ncbi:MAG TPA: ATP-binding protein [Cyanobacteria bacterium UBA8803]|nr:ATP-binding protein [Cyanobacteria bacterium UBA9273]HBL61376.1 ATP-binding protein [Cyanobacteria bacterium UBA8803]
MTQIFGEFRENLPSDQEFLILGFSPSSVPIKHRWRNNGLSADFVADYLTTFFPISEDDPSTQERQVEIKSAVSYIANELLENAMKFNDETSNYPIRFGLHLLEETNFTVVLFVTNSICCQASDKFQSFIQELINSDPAELYIQQLEKSALDESGKSSGLGLITMKQDYLAKLGWKFERLQKDAEMVAVTTMVQLTV